MTKLSDTQRAILTAAAKHPQGLVAPFAGPPAPRAQIERKLLGAGLMKEVEGFFPTTFEWRRSEGRTAFYRITDDGLRAIGIHTNADDAEEEDELSAEAIARRNAARRAAAEAAAAEADTAPTGAEDAAPEGEDAPVPEAAQAAPARAPRAKLRDAAAAVLAAWDANFAEEDRRNMFVWGLPVNPISGAIEQLRAALAGKPPRAGRAPGAPRKPRENTKQETVLAMLRREEGATIAQICEATGWQQHTVRGFFAGLKKRQGIEVKVRERIRQVGPNKTGAKGSFTIYQID
jgi:hypothetical protein